ncbi:MAG: hypothetical protein ACI4TL_04955 [Candidatus Cryptobacteroides sp.]
MRHIVSRSLMIALSILAISSCGSSKKAVVPDSSFGKKIEASECLTYALEAPKGVLRAFGEGVDTEYGYAYRFAVAQARDEMARILKTQVESGISLYRKTYAVGNTTREESKVNKDKMGENEDLITSICTSSVSGAKAVKTDQYYNEKNGEYTVHVCVEMDTDAVINNLDYDKIEQLISDEQRLEIDFNKDQFKKQLKADIEAYKNKR